MADDRWQEIQRLFEEALRQEPDQRAAFLSRACSDDAETRGEVESLLRHRHEASTGLLRPPEQAPAAGHDAEVAKWRAQRWEAEGDDASPHVTIEAEQGDDN